MRLAILFTLTLVQACARPPTPDASAAASEPRVGSAQPVEAPPPGRAPGIAVVELFTSEGCSSCPPADDVLARLPDDRRSRSERLARGAVTGRDRSGLAPDAERVFTLAFHVDYWNELGWIDPFSSADHSARQERYARALHRRGLFTPQAIVNGATSITGSEEDTLREAVRSALEVPAQVRITSHATKEGGRTTIAFSLDPVPPGAVVNAALLENDLATRVPRGENGGKTLHHTRVVRDFASVTATAEGRLVLRDPTGLTANTTLVVYAQDARTMAVLGATRPE